MHSEEDKHQDVTRGQEGCQTDGKHVGKLWKMETAAAVGRTKYNTF